ncbi:hypothetical protein IWW52_001516 [Coemansia sp. RSA 2704]|nr:hypothetical protein IWW52_001516 [Coemansia sp. RSA 2704]
MDVRVSQEYPSLVQLASDLTAVLRALETATRQLSKSGVAAQDQAAWAQLPAELPILDMLTGLEALQTELCDKHAQHTQAGGGELALLGLRDQRVVAQAVDLVVLFEVLPRLAPGTSVPLGKRMSSEAVSVMSSLLRLPNGRRNWQPSGSHSLAQIVLRLTQLGARALPGESDVAAAVLGSHHADLVAALLQLAYAPLPPDPRETRVPAYVEGDPQRRVELRRAFTRIFDGSSPYLMLETLTSLLNSAVRARQPRAPRWYAQLCGRFLGRVVLTHPADGVRIALDFLAARDEAPSAEKLGRVAALVLAPPAGVAETAYLQTVVPQLRRLAVPPGHVQLPGLQPAEQQRVEQAACFALRRLAESSPRAFGELVAEPLLAPLRRWFASRPAVAAPAPEPPALLLPGGAARGSRPVIQDLDAAEGAEAVSSGHELAAALDALRRLLLEGVPSARLASALAVPVFAPLCFWHAFERAQIEQAAQPMTEQTEQTTQALLLEVLVATLRALPASAACATVLELVQTTRADSHAERPRFARADGRTVLGWGAADEQQRMVDVDSLLAALGDPRLRALAGDVFMALLREQEALLEMAELGGDDVARRWWLVSQVVLAVVERFGPRVLTRHADILAFVLSILDRHGDACVAGGAEAGAQGPRTLEDLIQSVSLDGGDGAQTQDGAHGVERRLGGTEMVAMALLLLGQMMAAGEQAAFAGRPAADAPDAMPAADWGEPTLRLLRRIRDQARRLGQQAVPMVAQLATATAQQVSLVLALHALPPAGPDRTASGGPAADPDLERFAAAMRDVRNTDMVPVQAHGIVELRNLVLAKAPCVLADAERLEATVAVFVELAASPDSFLYLNAIRGLAALADVHARRFVPRLVAMYTGADSRLDERLRVGEALAQCVLRAGAMLGEHAGDVVPPLLASIEGAAPELVLSAVAVLAAAAQACPAALLRWIDDIAHALDSLLLAAARADDELAVAVRRAATVFWCDLVAAHEHARLLEQMDAGVLRAVYRTLRRLADADPDELVRLHAQSGVELIDTQVKSQLFPANYLP